MYLLPEADLLWALAVIAVLSVWIYQRSHRWSWSASPTRRSLAGLLTAAGLLAYVRWGYQASWILWLLPLSNVIVLGNWLPLFCSAIAGLAAGDRDRPRQGRLLTAGLLLGIGALALCRPILCSCPVEKTVARRWIHLQSTDVSCAAAAAATLLAWHDLPATEFDLAQLSLTGQSGTLWHGTYRGLKRMTADTPFDIEVVTASVEDLPSLRGPLLLHVGLNDVTHAPARYRDRDGWVPGRAHAIVFLRFNESGEALIIEPAVGRQRWTKEDLRWLWHGQAMRLTPRFPVDF
jgi:hypothetical protein